VSLSIWGYNVWDDNRAGDIADDIVNRLDDELGSPASGFDTEDLYKKYPEIEMPVFQVDGNDYIGQLDISELGLTLPVMSEWSYPNLKIAPCRYSGSAYTKDLVIAAHNYSRHFGRLKNLQVGSYVVFTDMDKHRFVYTVGEVEELPPQATEEMKDSGWDLTLFTCNRSGKKRIAVRCMEAEESPAQQN
jgi:sortase A